MQFQLKEHLFVLTVSKAAVGGNGNPAQSYTVTRASRSLAYVVDHELCRLPQDSPVEPDNHCKYLYRQRQYAAMEMEDAAVQ